MAIASPIWGNIPFEITQNFANTGYRPDWYQYSESLGLPAGVHPASDIGMPLGTKLYAARDGKIIQSGFSDSFRPYPVYLEDHDKNIVIYGHMRSNAVKTGDTVKQGQLLGESGEQTVKGTTTPDGSGPHLHLELRVPDAGTSSGYKAVDPLDYAQGRSVKGDGSSGGGNDGGGVTGILSNVSDSLGKLGFRIVLVIGGLLLGYLGTQKLLGKHTDVKLPTGKKTLKIATKVATRGVL